jgi:mRNA-degrading endonuclease toxin of MazEF toxin-antitoxin module
METVVKKWRNSLGIRIPNHIARELSLRDGSIENKKITGVVLSDQIKSLDWQTREIEFISKENPDKTDEIINKICVLLFK